jgi:hypothetical protein
MRIPGSVVVEQPRSGVCRFELVADFPQLSPAALDYAESRTRLPRPQAPGTPAEDADPATALKARTWELAEEVA